MHTEHSTSFGLEVELGGNGLEMRENTAADYSAAWTEYRRRRYLAILFGLCFLVVPPLTGRVMGNNRTSESIVGVLILALLLLTLVECWRLAMWPCPRCGKAFRGTAPFPRKCRNCGLPLWSAGPVTSLSSSPK